MTLYQLYVQYCHATNTPAELILDREEFEQDFWRNHANS